MDIKSFGGEFKLIKAISKLPKFHKVIKGIGDDCAVVPLNDKEYQIVTMDLLAEDDHFSLDYFSPYQVGVKAIESNLSDIAAMCGEPQYCFVGISLREQISVEWVKDFYKGIYSRTEKHGVDLIGGDTTHASKVIIAITLIGKVPKKQLVLRSGAKVGDIVKVTGPLGGSMAGWLLFKGKIPGHPVPKKKHLLPQCRLDLVQALRGKATAMADISDGLAGDLGNILSESKKGAILWAESIPIKKSTHSSAKTLNKKALDFALNGGEDFELVYTVPPKYENSTPGVSVGVITEGRRLYLRENDKIKEIEAKGFDHFG